MLILALDTATSATSVALYDGTAVLAQTSTEDAMRHGEVLAPGIAAVLREAGRTVSELTEIAVGVGPGPFTGLRVGLVTAHTMGAALSIPVHGVCTLDVLAADARLPEPPGPFLVAADARRKEVYWARYADRHHRVDGPHVNKPADIATDELVVGRGAVLYPDAFPNAREPQFASAGVLAALVAGRTVPLLEPRPLYLRRPDTTTPSGRKSVLAR